MRIIKKADLKRLIQTASGVKKADLLIRGGRLVNVFTGEIYREDIAVSGGYVAGFGECSAKRTLDVHGAYIVPGLIDGHLHIESTMMSVRQFARAVTPLGTTSCVIDPHEIANVLGIDGIKYMLESAKFQPINIFVMLPSCVPATQFETSGANLSAFDLYPFVSEKWVVGLAEVMNFPGVISATDEMLNKLKIFSDKRIDGHCPGLSGKMLSAYVAAGIRSDHETTSLKEAREKLRAGMFLMVREGTGAKNLEALLPLMNDSNKRRMIFVTDDRHPHDLIGQGHVNYMVRRAIDFGISPVDAIRCATLNTAEYFGLDFVGGVSPGYMADMLILSDLKKFRIEKVIKRGEVVAEKGEFTGAESRPRGTMLRSTVNVRWLDISDFRLKQKTDNARVIEIVPDQILTRAVTVKLPKAEYFTADVKRDLLKLFVIERHRASGNMGRAIVRGFGMKKGALASSVAHDSHNIITVGVEDESIMTAAVEIVKMGGGFAIADGRKVLARLPLPIAGLMSDRPLAELDGILKELIRIYRSELGGRLADPFMALSFLSLPVIPELKLSDLGLVDTVKFKLTDLFIKEEKK